MLYFDSVTPKYFIVKCACFGVVCVRVIVFGNKVFFCLPSIKFCNYEITRLICDIFLYCCVHIWIFVFIKVVQYPEIIIRYDSGGIIKPKVSNFITE